MALAYLTKKELLFFAAASDAPNTDVVVTGNFVVLGYLHESLCPHGAC
jgi:hypothetical protein